MVGYIYKTTNLINGKVYVGQKRSSSFVTSYIGSGTAITRAIRKHGKTAFKIELLCWCATKEELDDQEIAWIAQFRDLHGRQNCYNITDGGGGSTGHVVPDEVKKRFSELYRGQKRPQEAMQKQQKTRKHNDQLRAQGALPPHRNTGHKLTPERLAKKLASQAANQKLREAGLMPRIKKPKKKPEAIAKQKATRAKQRLLRSQGLLPPIKDRGPSSPEASTKRLAAFAKWRELRAQGLIPPRKSKGRKADPAAIAKRQHTRMRKLIHNIAHRIPMRSRYSSSPTQEGWFGYKTPLAPRSPTAA